MITPPQRIITDDSDVLPAVREPISNSPDAAYCGAETVAGILYAKHFLPYRPTIFAVEATLRASRLGSGEVAA